MKSVKDVPVNYSFPFRSCSFHASGPEWPQKTQHTRLQEVLVFLLMIPLLFFFFSHTLSLRTFPPSALLSARKLSLLVSLTQNANLISKLWTIEKLLFLRPQDWLKRKSWISLSSCFFFPVAFDMWTRPMQRFIQNLPTLYLSFSLSPQDAKDFSLKRDATTTTNMTWEENMKGLTSYL